MAEPIRKLGGKSGRPVISHDGGATWQYDEAAPAPAAAPAAPAGGPPKRFDQAAPGTDNALRTAQDAGRNLYEGVRGIGSAVTFGFDDEMATALGADPNDKAKGRAFSARQAELAGPYMPSASTMGEVAGTVATSVGGAGLARGVTGAGQKALAIGGSAAGQGALQGAGDAAAGEKVGGALGGAAMGAALGQGGKLVGKGLSAAGSMAPGLKRLADKARVNAAGMNPRAADDLPGGIPEAAATIRKHGIGKGLAGSNKMEMQAQQAIDNVEGQRENLRAPVRAAGDLASGGNVAHPLRKRAAELESANQARADYLRKRADEFEFQKQKSFRMEPETVPPGDPVTREMRPRKARPGQDTMVDPSNAERFAPTQVELPRGAGPRPGPPPTPQPRMRPVPTEIKSPRLYDIDQLRAARGENAPQKWASDAQGAESAKDIHQAFSNVEADLIDRNTPGAGGQYRQLGREEAVLMEARRGLLGADPGQIPAGKYDALRRVVSGGRLGNVYASGVEGAAGAAGAAARGGAAVQRAAGSLGAQSGASILTRRAQQQIDEAEYPEDEYYRQYMSNPDFQHSRR